MRGTVQGKKRVWMKVGRISSFQEEPHLEVEKNKFGCRSKTGVGSGAKRGAKLLQDSLQCLIT